MLRDPTEQPFRAERVEDAAGLWCVTFRGETVGWVAGHERHARIAKLNGIYAATQSRRRAAMRAATGEGRGDEAIL